MKRIAIVAASVLLVSGCRSVPGPACPRPSDSSQSDVIKDMPEPQIVVIKYNKPSAIAAVLTDFIEFYAKHPDCNYLVGASKVMGEDNSGLLILLTASKNMTTFEKLIRVLDSDRQITNSQHVTGN